MIPTNDIAACEGLPLIRLDDLDAQRFIAYFRDNRSAIESSLLQKGALKFTGIHIDSPETFQTITGALADKFLDYIDGNSPRTKLSGSVYTSTEYVKTQKITMHNELSYSAKWPGRLYFSCLQPAATGGETLLADSREILRHMDTEIVSAIRQRGIIYIRNLHGGNGVGQSWQNTFETNDRGKVIAYCNAYGIDFEWRDKNGLRLKQRRAGIIRHRTTGEEVWFNQIDQFHPYQMGEEVFDSMLEIYDSPTDFPIYVTFGNGEVIPTDMIEDILSTIEKQTIYPAWEKDQLLILDNERMSHGRNSYTGERKVLVTMSE
jgi:hypothetical protein